MHGLVGAKYSFGTHVVPGGMFRTVLVTIDGSDDSERALALAIQIAQAFEGTLHIVTVTRTHVIATQLGGAIAPPTTDDIRSADELLRAAQTQAKAKGVELVITQVLEGPTIPDEILDYAAKIHPDILVTGARGLTTGQRWLLGSVSDSLVRKAPCPILVARPPPSS
ncbi:MAG: universal stress protein [Thermoplasmata archaeon]